MAVTKIWPVKESLARVVDYAQNPDKTIYSDLRAVLHYAANEEKTVEGEERAMFVTGVNCNRDTAFQEMQAVKERFGKTGGNVAYHAYQSFKPGEVTPELCHQLGVELAKRMWGDEYQVLVATHFNTGTYLYLFVLEKPATCFPSAWNPSPVFPLSGFPTTVLPTTAPGQWDTPE